MNKMTSHPITLSLLAGLAAVLFLRNAKADDIALYPTGPAADSSFVRFLDGTDGGVDVISASKRVALTPEKPATAFLPVPAKWRVNGQMTQGSHRAPVDLQVSPGEFATVVAIADAKGLVTLVLREQPDDFNALKVSIGFANLADTVCTDAALKVAGREVFLFEHSQGSTVQRRLVNPVSFGVRLTCAGKPVGDDLSFGTISAGERYSVLVVPGTSKQPKLLFVHDQISH